MPRKRVPKVLQVACPTCYADPSELCWTPHAGELPLHYQHSERKQRTPRRKNARVLP